MPVETPDPHGLLYAETQPHLERSDDSAGGHRMWVKPSVRQLFPQDPATGKSESSNSYSRTAHGHHWVDMKTRLADRPTRAVGIRNAVCDSGFELFPGMDWDFEAGTDAGPPGPDLTTGLGILRHEEFDGGFQIGKLRLMGEQTVALQYFSDGDVPVHVEVNGAVERPTVRHRRAFGNRTLHTLVFDRAKIPSSSVVRVGIPDADVMQEIEVKI